MVHGAGLSRVLLLTENIDDQESVMLERLLRRAGLAREQFLFGIAEDGWFQQAVASKCKVVVPLGEAALRCAARQSDITRWRGRVIEHPDHPFFTLPTFNPTKLVHRRADPERPDPETLRNPPRYQGRFVRDLHYAIQVAEQGFTRMPTRYVLDPAPEVLMEWVREYLRQLEKNPDLLLSWDIETPYRVKHKHEDELEESEKQSDLNTSIIRTSFSYREGEAITAPNQGPWLPAMKLALGESGPKVGWNCAQFDVPVCGANGLPVNGTVYDGMDAWKMFKSDLDKGLEAVSADCSDLLPWKHLSDAMPAHYCCTDSDAALRNVHYIFPRLVRQGTWPAFIEAVVQGMPVLKEAGDRGNAIDLEYQAWLREELRLEDERLDAAIQPCVPLNLRPRKRFKKIPDAVIERSEGNLHWTVEGRIFEVMPVTKPLKTCSACGEAGVTQAHVTKKSLGKTLRDERHHAKKCPLGSGALPLDGPPACGCPKGWPKRTWDVQANPCAGATVALQPQLTAEFDEILPFNAGSSHQLKAYMHAHKHPVGKHKKDASKETADAKHLEFLDRRYGKKFPLYGLALQQHKVHKAQSTYLWEPAADGFIHTTYTNSPSTWRLGSRAYNLQNVGKREGNPWAKLARLQIIARPGHRLVQADSTSIEAVMLGWFMGDLDYIKLANQSVHAWLACRKLGWEFNPDTMAKVKAEHGTLYDQMKVANHMTNYGGTGYVLWQTFPNLFKSADQADAVQQEIYTLLPRLEAYHYETRYLAHKQTYLESPWKVRHDFFDVFTYKRDRWGNPEFTATGRPKLKLGKDGKRCVAFNPQHSAGMFARYNCNLFAQTELRPYMPANLTVHDSYCFDVPWQMEDRAREILVEVLTRPIPEMAGLRVGCEVEVGENWGSYNANPKKGRLNLKGMNAVDKITIHEQTLGWIPAPMVPVAMVARAA